MDCDGCSLSPEYEASQEAPGGPFFARLGNPLVGNWQAHPLGGGGACGIVIHLRDLRNCRQPTFFLFLEQGEAWSLLFHLCRVELERGKYPVLSSSRLLSSSSEFFCKCGPDSVRKKLHLLIFVLVNFLPFIVLLVFLIIGKQTLFVCDLLQVP
jgi:hypothetical protein